MDKCFVQEKPPDSTNLCSSSVEVSVRCPHVPLQEGGVILPATDASRDENNNRFGLHACGNRTDNIVPHGHEGGDALAARWPREPAPNSATAPASAAFCDKRRTCCSLLRCVVIDAHAKLQTAPWHLRQQMVGVQVHVRLLPSPVTSARWRAAALGLICTTNSPTVQGWSHPGTPHAQEELVFRFCDHNLKLVAHRLTEG